MSRQNKAIQKKIIAKQFTALHLQGQKGPARTTAKHGKVNTQKAARLAELRAKQAQAESVAQGKAVPQTTGKGSKYSQKQGTRKAA